MKVVLKRGPLPKKTWYRQTLQEARRRAEALSDLHGDCKVSRLDGLFIVHAGDWYQRAHDRKLARKIMKADKS